MRYGAHRAVREVSFSARGGEVLALLGPNGSGKSSLLRAAAGLLRHEGRVAWDGLAGKGIGFLPQDNGARTALTVLETVLLGRLRALGMRVAEAEVTRAIAALDRLGIAGLAPRLLGELSGGQRQMVFLAQLLCAEPAALLLDEPTSALDLRNQFELLGLLRRLAREHGLLVIVAIHDLNAAAAFADRLAVLREGRLVATGAPDFVLTPRLMAEVYGLEAEVCVSPTGRRVMLPVAALR
ncbi:ABC transporter ATP-binding protein [Roseomonas sp. ROY-5-3]|uniref:ABC transporter ATP-binding protein n=1 Tax=Falsiroseomonas oleicola TaxID=2801474 RepID=A0ABS6HCG9_9PROT|nr:ABC transporter ATP-binding protein [Roseomonas oleicola]